MKPLENKEVIQIIHDYIYSTKSRYAVLIDGNWGSGKTFCIKEEVIPYIKNCEANKKKKKADYTEKKIIYISLYGLSSCEEISKQIWIKTVPLIDKMGDGKLKSFIDKASTLGNVLLSNNNISFDKVDFSKLISPEKLILVFDDLERCNISANEVLGYINSFVEHDGIKTIIIANQKEIGKIGMYSNIEAKYMLVLNDKLDFNYEVNSSNPFRERHLKVIDENVKITRDIINDRIIHLFNEDKIYMQIKEKLIGLTIVYRPDIERMTDVFIKDLGFDENLSGIITRNKNYIIESTNKYTHENLRTLQFSLERFQRIYNTTSNLKQNESLTITLEEIFKYMYVLSILIKQGKKIPEWSDNVEYISRNLSNKQWSFDYITGFKFIDDYIFSAYFDESRILKIIQEYSQGLEEAKEAENNSLSFLTSSWWELEDDKIVKLIDDITVKLSDNQYNLHFYPKIIACFIGLKDINFDIDIDHLIEIMKLNIMKREIKKDTNILRRGEGVESHFRESYNAYVKQLTDLISTRIDDSDENDINTLIEYKLGWTDSFIEYVNENRDRFMLKKQFFALLNIAQLVNCLKQSNAYDLSLFRRALDIVYDFSNIEDYFIDDYYNISKLITQLETPELDLEEISRTRKFNLELLIKQIKDYKKRLAKPCTEMSIPVLNPSPNRLMEINIPNSRKAVYR